MILTLLALIVCFASCKKGAEMKTDTAVVSDTIVSDSLAMEERVSEIPLDSAAVQKAWEAYMTPSDVHKMLAEETGSWTNEMTFWMGPDAEPQKAVSDAEIKMILGGRYQQIHYQGDMMGMPFEGIATVAYDNSAKEIISTWMDNMGTGMLVLRGKYDGSGNAITTAGSMVNPVTGKEIEVREVYTLVDENTRKMEMFNTEKNEEEYKSMEIIMTRK